MTAAEALFQVFEGLPKGDQQRFALMLKDHGNEENCPSHQDTGSRIRAKLLSMPKRTPKKPNVA